MNNFKWQSVIERWIFLSFENSFWIKLPDSIITVDVKHHQTITSEQIQNRESKDGSSGVYINETKLWKKFMNPPLPPKKRRNDLINC